MTADLATLTEPPAVPAMVFSLAEVLAEEMGARGWTIEDAAGRMAVTGPASDALTLALVMSVQDDRLLLEDDFLEGLGRAFEVSPAFFRNIHRIWSEHPTVRQPFSAPDALFGPWLRSALAQAQTEEGRHGG